MLDKKGQVSVTPDEKALHDSISILSGEVSRLQDEKKSISEEIDNYKGNLTKYKEQKIILDEIMSHIEGKKIILSKMNEEFDSLFKKNNELSSEFESLSSKLEERKKLVSEVEDLKKQIFIIQEDMALYHDKYSNMKNDFQSKLDGVKNNILNLHKGIGEVVDNM